MASKRRFKGCQSDDVFQHMEKQPLLDIPDHDSAEFGRCELVFSQYELLRRICAHLPTQDLFRASCGKIQVFTLSYEIVLLHLVTVLWAVGVGTLPVGLNRGVTGVLIPLTVGA